jgi:hypothetical protein
MRLWGRFVPAERCRKNNVIKLLNVGASEISLWAFARRQQVAGR